MLPSSAVSAPQQAARPFRILVVCTGNLHRSPVAERLLRARLVSSQGGFEVHSAGTAGIAGTPMDPFAARLLVELGGDPQGAVARRLTAAHVEEADLVLGAGAEHREAAVRLCPVQALQRAFTLREFTRLMRPQDAAGVSDPAGRAALLVRGAASRRGSAGRGDDDVADPHGAPAEAARKVARRIADAVEHIASAVLGHPADRDIPLTGTSG
ncbi:low molecular weight phosphatase family protein [Streptomyces sp. 142MFCol3.1]|uniref:arsenate reductase/protein-tyrosine-phosphatase family protein n=1 Tax=Streptomyces sp. 142MFCol3.1 TaxID=1172179 RepID=UPI000685F70C|nr:low molecular weight phosphatase family protein [Streptomyces sp. 142MFCol3.1]